MGYFYHEYFKNNIDRFFWAVVPIVLVQILLTGSFLFILTAVPTLVYLIQGNMQGCCIRFLAGLLIFLSIFTFIVDLSLIFYSMTVDNMMFNGLIDTMRPPIILTVAFSLISSMYFFEFFKLSNIERDAFFNKPFYGQGYMNMQQPRPLGSA